MMDRVLFSSGALFALIGIAAGAFGAHALKGRLDADMLAVFEVAVRYQIYHAFALMACAWASTRWPGMFVNTAAWLFVAGIVVFCGSLYLLSISGQRWLGAITPIGGFAFIAGWVCLAAAALKS